MLQLDPFFGVAALLMILKSLSEKVELTVSEARIVTSLPIFAPRNHVNHFFFDAKTILCQEQSVLSTSYA